jgi:hypothetical protein
VILSTFSRSYRCFVRRAATWEGLDALNVFFRMIGQIMCCLIILYDCIRPGSWLKGFQPFRFRMGAAWMADSPDFGGLGGLFIFRTVLYSYITVSISLFTKD